MLEHLHLRNFRSWTALELELKPVTLIFGPNSSGKTALLHSLLMLKQTAESNDRSRSLCFGDYADLGSFREVVSGRDESLGLEVGLDWRPLDEVVLRDDETDLPPLTADVIGYQARWELLEEVQLASLLYRVPGLSLRLSRTEQGGYDWDPKKSQALGSRRRGRPWPLPGPESCYALPRIIAQEWPQTNLLELNHQFELLMNRIQYVGPLRRAPRREYLWSGEAPGVIGADGAQAVEALLAQQRAFAANGGAKGRRRQAGLVEQTARWLKEFGLAARFAVEAIDRGQRYYEVRLNVPGAGMATTALPDVGFGVSQVLPIIVQMLFAPEGSILLFEQPEIHLHPKAAALLADLFLEVAASRRLQLIIETHSEYLLSRLQRRVAEADLPLASPESIAIYFCALRDGGSAAELISLNEFGQIENWPADFFGDSIGDLRAMTEAMVRRKAQGGSTDGHGH